MSAANSPSILTLPDGVRIAYHYYSGTGPGVIFCGGFSSDMTGTKAMKLDDWCRRRGQSFLRFDYQGHGASSGRFEEGTIGSWTGDALAVLDRLTTGPQILVGSSMGGWIMLLLALARPERIAGLVGVACAADFTESMLWQQLDAATQARLRQDGVIYVPSCYEGEDPYPITLRLIEEARQHLLLECDRLPIHCPVRLLHGMRDPDVPWQNSVRVAEKLASENVRVLLVKDGEHRMSRDSDLNLLLELLAELIERAKNR
ncbi:MAG TPA: alpha/beta hydrolase [Candidatus Competibacteraceae bacterium]|nr:alpha/beta hydrolase [Candidatus Competibacteraceae bacterium]